MTALIPVDGDHVVPGMVLVDAAGEHEVAWFDPYPGRFIGDTPDESARVAHYVDGGERTIRDHGHYHRKAA